MQWLKEKIDKHMFKLILLSYGIALGAYTETVTCITLITVILHLTLAHTLIAYQERRQVTHLLICLLLIRIAYALVRVCWGLLAL